jgi:hypothetical protein
MSGSAKLCSKIRNSGLRIRFSAYAVVSSALLCAAFLSPGKAQAQNCSAAVANKVGDIITVTAALTTTDPNENGEGETLTIASSGSETVGTVSAYFVATQFTYTATQANEVISGTLAGFDSDESCSLTVTANKNSFLTQAQKTFFSQAATALTVPAAGFADLAVLCTGTLAGAPICGLPSALLTAGFTTAAALSGAISLDPSDPNYMQIATPVTPNIPPVGSQAGIPQIVTGAVNALLQNQAQIVGLEQALVTTLNRAQGASDANNAYWLQQQLDAATLYLGQLSQLYSQMAGLLTQLSSALTAAGLNVTLTANEVLNFEVQVAASGLPAAVVAAMQQFGADNALIQDATDLIFVTTSMMLPEVFRIC